jgi:predicted metalloprotease with PDZ domain
VYALDNSVRAAWLDPQRGFFNGTSLFLQVHGQEGLPHALELVAHKACRDWEVATGLRPPGRPPRVWALPGRRLRRAGGLPGRDGHLLARKLQGAWYPAHGGGGRRRPTFDGDKLLADTRRICEAAISLWHGKPGGRALAHKPPHRDYVFMLNAVDDGYGGLEHRNSTALICARKDLPRVHDTGAGALPPRPQEGYHTLLGLISHEYFHTWNVKRLRPAEFARYRLSPGELHRLLWFFEGFTSYYDDLLLRRAGLLDDAAYLKSLTKTLNQVLQTPGRLVQSVAQASAMPGSSITARMKTRPMPR